MLLLRFVCFTREEELASGETAQILRDVTKVGSENSHLAKKNPKRFDR
ncbi:hypothetical protein CA13_53580 [Planctomycetes bacterium CA13]|uniref:Uncharacterized protein n=1 Tax=Novipirellula herctigrandis TaxID=2527986 RepID=A0A5C5Z9K0_9BACT|nr:hypothetical protein CA13_53580 [Planctomycetes bacterium CA13]